MRIRNLPVLIAPVAVVCIAALLAPIGGAAGVSIVSFGLINLVLVLAMYTFVGNTGVVSFGHAGFVAIGAYVGALTSMAPGTKQMLLPNLPEFLTGFTLPFWGSLLLAGLAAGLAALLVGVPLMRLNGFAAGIGTLAFLMIVRNAVRNWKDVTGGAGTLNGIPIQASLPLLTGVVVVVILIAFLYQSSRRGRLARATREDRIAAQALGVNVFGERIAAFVLSGALAGVGERSTLRSSAR